MRAFGIEIRKSGTIGNLYRDVDITLRNAGLLPGQSVNAAVQVQAVAHALQRMIKADHWFCVCTIDSCVKICQVVIPSERYAIYRAAHCIHWNEMTPDYRQTLIAMVLDDFRSVLNPVS